MKRSKHTPLMRLTTFFTAIALMLTLFGIMPEGVIKAGAYTDSNGTYWYYSIGGAIAVGGTWEPEWKATILSCTPGDSKDVTVPAEVPDDQGGMHTVTAIGYDGGHGRGAFEDKNVTSVSLPSTVNYIGKLAFHNCTNLTKIKMSDAITTIDDCAFEDCSVLTDINMPSSLKTIGRSAFNGCSSLKRINLPDTVTSLKRECFESCTALESVRLSNNLTEIPERAFAICKNIKSLYIPDGVTKIGSYAFSNMSSLKAIYLPKETTEINPVAFYKTDSAVIYGYKGSAAETYAAENGLDFVAIDDLFSNVTYTIKPKLSSKIIKPESLAAGTSLKGVADGTEIRMGAGGTYEGKVINSMSLWFGVNVTSYSGTTKLSTSTPTGVTVTVEGDSFTAKLSDTLDRKAVLEKIIENAGKGYTSVLTIDVEVTPTYGEKYVGKDLGTLKADLTGEDENLFFDDPSLYYNLETIIKGNRLKELNYSLFAAHTPPEYLVYLDYPTSKSKTDFSFRIIDNKLRIQRSAGYTASGTYTLSMSEESAAEYKAEGKDYYSKLEIVFPGDDEYVPSGIGTYTFYLDKEDHSYFDFGESDFAEAFKATLYALDKSGRITKNGSYYDIDKDGSTDIYLSNNYLFMADTRSVGEFSDTYTLTDQEEGYAREYYSAMTPAEQKTANASYMNSITFVFPKLEKNVELTNKGSYTLDLSSGSAAITDDAAKVEIYETLKALADTGAIVYNNTNGTYDIDNDSNYDIKVSGANYTVLDTASIEGVKTIALTAEQIAAVKDNINKRWSILIDKYGFGYYNTISFIFPTKPHTHTEGQAKKENIVPTTCTTAGSYDEVVRCTKCGEVISKTHVVAKAAGHTPAAAVKENVKDSTCTKEGSYDEVVYCSVCHEEISRVTKTIAKKAHTLTKIARVEPTTEKAGNIEYYKCSVCGKLFADAAGTKEITAASTVIPKLEKHIPGDANDDGLVTVDDALLIQQAIAGWNVKINLKNADCDGYEGLSVDDVLLIQQSIAGWSVTLK